MFSKSYVLPQDVVESHWWPWLP